MHDVVPFQPLQWLSTKTREAGRAGGLMQVGISAVAAICMQETEVAGHAR